MPVILVFLIFYLVNNFLYKLSTIIAPNGAVIKKEITARVNAISPTFNPIDNGIAPIAA